MNSKTAIPTNLVDAVTKRIDAIGEQDPGAIYGLSWYYIRLILLTGIGWAMDSAETFVFIYCSEMIFQDIAMNVAQKAFLGGAVFVGSFIGSFLFGTLADGYGRKPMFMATMMVFLIGIGLCAVSWNFWSIALFRILSGIGLGGELPVASTLVQELSPKKFRGKVIVLLESFWAIGVMVAVLLAFGLSPKIGWRWTFGICVIPVIYAAVIRLWIPESPKWLASVGRYNEAMEIVKNIEQAHGLTSLEEENAEQGQSRVSVIQGLSSLPTSMFERILLLFCHPYSVRTSVLWILWFGISMSYYAIYIYLPAIIGKTGYNIAATWENILLITAFQLPGYLAASYLVEVFGRKKTLVAFLMGSFVFAIIMAYVPGTKENAIVFCGCCLSFFLLGAWGCVYAYTPENYPTAIRGMGSAYPAGFSRIGAFIGPYLIPFMDQEWGMSIAGIMWVFGGVLIFISLVVLAFGFEPKGKDLETMEEFEQQKEEEYHGAETPIWR